MNYIKRVKNKEKSLFLQNKNNDSFQTTVAIPSNQTSINDKTNITLNYRENNANQDLSLSHKKWSPESQPSIKCHQMNQMMNIIETTVHKDIYINTSNCIP